MSATHRRYASAYPNFIRRIAVAALAAGLTAQVAVAQMPTLPDVPSRPTAVTTSELVEIRNLSGLAVSADGLHAAVRVDHQELTRNSSFAYWTVVRLADGKETRLADAGTPRLRVNGDPASEMPQWSADGSWIHYLSLTGEEVQVWRAKSDGSGSEQLTHDPADVQAFIVSPTNILHYAVSGATREEIKAAEVADAENGVLLDSSIITGLPVTKSFPVNGRMATYRFLLPARLNSGRSTLLGDRPLRFMSLDLRDFKATPADKETANALTTLWESAWGGTVPFDPVGERSGWTEDHSKIALVAAAPNRTENQRPESRSGNFLQWRSGGSDGPDTVCEAVACLDADRITVVGWLREGKRLAFQTMNFGSSSLHVWNTTTGAVQTIATSDAVFGSHANGIAGKCQLANEDIICIVSAADVPPKLVAINIQTGRQRVLLDPNPRLTPDRIGIAEKVVLTDRFGGTTYGWLVFPRHKSVASPAKLPLVITSYSCPGFLLGGSGHDIPEHVLAGLGYAAICVDTSGFNVRRKPGFGWSGEQLNQSAMDFFEDAARVLAERGAIDPQRVMLSGFSGSSTAITYGLPRSDWFTAAIVTTESGLDPIYCYLSTQTGVCRRSAQSKGYSLPYDRTGLFSNSPAWNAEKITTPLLMQLAEVEYRSMMQLYAALVDYERAVEMYIFPDAYHYKHQPRQRLSVYDRNVEWIEFWLRGAENHDSPRSGQYSRWRNMREKQCMEFSARLSMPASAWYCATLH